MEGHRPPLGDHAQGVAPKEIKFLRQQMDMTQPELGARLRLSDQSVARWEKDQCGLPGPADLMLRVLFLGQPGGAAGGKEMLRDIIKLLDKMQARDESKQKADVFEHGKQWQDSERELELA
jgi:transcriptional regulator with XRE-family HTH domain